MSNLVKKQVYELDSLDLVCNKSIPVKLGYETYGELNHNKDNVILIEHYFSASSHAAFRYQEEDPAPGWWDGLIGPGKAIDTDKYFVICTDNLCNVQVKNPMIITTGPASINPKTNKPYGMEFPVISFYDMVEAQKKLLDSMGIKQLKAVAGPSAGGMIAFCWAVKYPHMVENCIGVITNVQNPVITSFSVLQHGIRAIELDQNFQDGTYYGKEEPVEGLRLAAQMMTVGAFTPAFMQETYPRTSQIEDSDLYIDKVSGYEQSLYQAAALSSQFVDANSWLYTCRMTMNHDIAKGFGSMEEALSRITARVLMIPCKQDLLQNYEFNLDTVNRINDLGGKAELFLIESKKGHMAGVLEPELFAHKVKAFLEQQEEGI